MERKEKHLNVLIPLGWWEGLRLLAYQSGVEQHKTVTVSDVVREAIEEKLKQQEEDK
jgi:hypothetical protein